MGVLIINIWAVVLEVFLPCLSLQMDVLAKCPLTTPHQHFVRRHYLLPLQTGGPSGVGLDIASLRGEISIGSGE